MKFEYYEPNISTESAKNNFSGQPAIRRFTTDKYLFTSKSCYIHGTIYWENMQQAFNLSLTLSDLIRYSSITPSIVSEFKSRSRTSLQSNLKNGILDAKSIESDWFGTVEADVFISHSHRDLDLAIKLAGILKNELGLSAFVDSNVWGYSDELIKIIDNEFCLKSSTGNYDYNQRNKSTSHVHLMLSAALIKMIDKCEMVLFLNTSNSISTQNYVRSGAETTASPWIYSELTATKFLRKKKRPRPSNESHQNPDAMDSIPAKSFPEVSYEAYLSHLTPMCANDLHFWCKQKKTETKALDFIYQFLPDPDI